MALTGETNQPPAASPQPFRISVDQAVLTDLHDRLRRTRWPTGPDGWDFGTSTSYLKEISNYWLNHYDWWKAEAWLNRLPQFQADLGNARIHFVHEKRGEGSLPLLLLHGWPDSFYRFYKVLPELATPAGARGAQDRTFDVVVPSLPGFGFTGKVAHASSEQPTRRSAELLWRLMTEVLGYRSFGVVGGDGGSVLSQIMAIDHPESVLGVHLTDLGWHAANVDPSKASAEERKYLEASRKRFMADGAYAMLQSTKPQSLAPALTDSPSGLAAWIIDRFHSWCGGDLEESFTKDELLTNVTIYWVTQTIGSSMRTYHDDARSPSLTTNDHVDVPVALALFPKDIGGVPPRSLAERTLNVQRWTEMPRGGHFAALEEPELFARDVREFFGALPVQR